MYVFFHVFGHRFVHRLDYSTSGSLCIALNKNAAAIAGDKFKNREVIKEYLALVRAWSRYYMEKTAPQIVTCNCTAISKGYSEILRSEVHFSPISTHTDFITYSERTLL